MKDKVLCPWCGGLMTLNVNAYSDGTVTGAWYECLVCKAESPYIEDDAADDIKAAALSAALQRYVPAELVRHGRWEYREELQYFTIIEMMDCSVCGEHQNPEQVEAWAYCPNCGARMDLDPAMEKEDSR